MLDQKDGMRMIYNNVYMGDILKYSCESEPVKEDKIKTTKYIKYTYTVDAIIFGDKNKYKTEEFEDSEGPGQWTMLTSDVQDKHLIEPHEGSIKVNNIPAYVDGAADDILSLMKMRLLESRKSLFILNGGFGNVLIQGDVQHGNDPDWDSFHGNDYLSGKILKEYMKSIGAYTEPITEDVDVTLADEIPTGGEERSSEWDLYRFRDVKFGPEPNILKWEPIAGRKSARVVFEISFYVKDCLAWPDPRLGESNKYDSIGLLTNFIYSMSYDIDDLGYQTRTVNGQAEITNNTQVIYQNRNHRIEQDIGVPPSLPRIAKSADDVRDSVLLQFICPYNFRRTSQKFNISEDRSVLTFTIQDTQEKTQEIYPAGVVDLDVTHNVSSSGISSETASKSTFFTHWNNQMSATITLARDEPYHMAFVIFSRILMTRLIGISRTSRKTRDGVDDLTGSKSFSVDARTVLPAEISITEKLYKQKQKYTFSFSWVLIAKSADETSEMLERTGLFTSITNEYQKVIDDSSDTKSPEDLWQEWKSRLSGTAGGEDNRGNARLKEEFNYFGDSKGEGFNIGQGPHNGSTISKAYDPMVNEYLPDKTTGTGPPPEGSSDKETTSNDIKNVAEATSKNPLMDTCDSAKMNLTEIAEQQNNAFKPVSIYSKYKQDLKVTALPMWNNSYGSAMPYGKKWDKGFDINEESNAQDSDSINKGYSLVSYRTKLSLSSSSDDVRYERQRSEQDIDISHEQNNEFKTEGQDAYKIESNNYVGDQRPGREPNNISRHMPKMHIGTDVDYRIKKAGTGTRTISRVSPRMTATLTWSAKRVGGPMPAPRVISIGGAPVELINSDLESEIINTDLDLPLYKTTGIQYLSVKGTPKGLKLECDGMPTKKPT